MTKKKYIYSRCESSLSKEFSRSTYIAASSLGVEMHIKTNQDN